MRDVSNARITHVLAVCGLTLCTSAAVAADSKSEQEQKVLDAMSAAPATVAQQATIMDWDGTVLKKGSDEWVCYPTPPHAEKGPMCLDSEWQRWAKAWMNKEPFEPEQVGIAYMLQGDSGSSNTDPHATEPASDNEWVVAGPHLMMITPGEGALNDLPSDPRSGAPWVMWRGTPYEHVMVPVH